MHNFLNPLAHRPSAAWRWLGVIIISLLVLAIGSLLVIRDCRSGTSVEEVDSLVRTNLPPGSSAEDVFDFLDARRIEYARRVGRPSEYSELGSSDVPGNAGIIRAIIRNTGTFEFFGTTDIQVIFILDDQQKLRDQNVFEVYTGP